MKRLLVLIMCCISLTSNAMTIEKAQIDQVRVALIDSGINTKIVGEENVLEGKNYVREGYTTDDKLGHGTAVAELILKYSPNAKLIPLTYCDEVYGDIISVDLYTVSQMILDAVDIYNCDIINISAGTQSESDELKKSIEYAEEKGVLVVSAVGNSVSDKANYPANYDTVIGVGALDEKGDVASFSANMGVSIVALGEKLQVTLPNGKEGFVTGTSFACAEVTASIVQILEENRGITHKEVREQLFNKAIDIGNTGFDTTSGYGKITSSK